MQEGSKDRYFQDVEDDVKKLVPEGIVGRVPYKGELNESMQQFIGGLRAGMGYCGSKDILTLKEDVLCALLQGINESHPHNVTITKKHRIIRDNPISKEKKHNYFLFLDSNYAFFVA
jgi:IMP dehydrogenase